MASFDYDVVIIGSGFGGSSRFDITTGAVINGPATDALNVHEVKEVDSGIQIRVRST
jgi:hypothetical protein